MDRSVQTQSPKVQVTSYHEAWEMVMSQLRAEMSRALFETWVQPLRPMGYQNQVFTLGAYNPYARDWVESHLGSRINRLLEGLFNEPVQLQIQVANAFYQGDTFVESPPQPKPENHTVVREEESSSETPAPKGPAQSTRKVMLQRAYGSERASIIQPERGMFVTLYFFQEWVPLLGHSAAATVLAARSMCYWNPMTGDLRNVVETEMGELARRASVSVRTVKDVLNNELVQKYFLRYKVRRMITPNGVRTAGIYLQVRMDDPLTPSDQEATQISEEDWYLPEFSDEDD